MTKLSDTIPSPDDFVALLELTQQRVMASLEAASEMERHLGNEVEIRRCYADAKRNLQEGLATGIRAVGWPDAP